MINLQEGSVDGQAIGLILCSSERDITGLYVRGFADQMFPGLTRRLAVLKKLGPLTVFAAPQYSYKSQYER